ncbi:very low-density lipoprotein receptor-like, partial [Cherax quadricarinatus]
MAEFNCSSGGSCVPMSFKCDGDEDCADGSDEQQCSLEQCTGTDFRCIGDKKCIGQVKVCDGVYDCEDKSDEALCPSQPHTLPPTDPPAVIRLPSEEECTEADFRCIMDKKCIGQASVCDGVDDCEDNSDEAHCPTTVTVAVTDPPAVVTLPSDFPQVVCKTGLSQCKSGSQCILKRWWCDGETNCEDNSDEDQCDQ